MEMGMLPVAPILPVHVGRERSVSMVSLASSS